MVLYRLTRFGVPIDYRFFLCLRDESGRQLGLHFPSLISTGVGVLEWHLSVLCSQVFLFCGRYCLLVYFPWIIAQSDTCLILGPDAEYKLIRQIILCSRFLILLMLDEGKEGIWLSDDSVLGITRNFHLQPKGVKQGNFTMMYEPDISSSLMSPQPTVP